MRLETNNSPNCLFRLRRVRHNVPTVRTTWRIDWINWPVHSQQTAQKNARRALVELARRRREGEAVERFLENREAAPLESRNDAKAGPRSAHEPSGRSRPRLG